METLKIIVDLKNDNVRTEGMIHQVKGNVDGNVNLQESGISEITDREEITEYFQDEYGDDYDVEVEFE